MAKRGKDGLLVYKKNDNAKCRYSLPSNLLYLIKFIGKFDKTFLPLLFLMTAASAAVEPMWSFFNRDMVNFVLESGKNTRLLISMGVIFIIIMCVCSFHQVLENKIHRSKERNINLKFDMKLNEKMLDTDYENRENPATNTMFQKAVNAAQNFTSFYNRIAYLITNIFSVLGWSAILSTLSPWLILIVLAPTVAYYMTVHYKIKWYSSREDTFTDIERKISYAENTAKNFQNAKDIRLYNMESWFVKTMRKFIEKRLW